MLRYANIVNKGSGIKFAYALAGSDSLAVTNNFKEAPSLSMWNLCSTQHTTHCRNVIPLVTYHLLLLL